MSNAAEILAKFGEVLLEDLFRRNLETGGREILITGSPGKGKTTLLIHFAQKALALGDKVIWLGRPIDHFYRIPHFEHKIHIFAHKNDRLRIKLIKDDEVLSITRSLKLTKYKDGNHLLKKLKKSKINVVFPPSVWYPKGRVAQALLSEAGIPDVEGPLKGNSMWFELFYALIHKEDLKFYTVLLDEADDLWPNNAPYPYWHLIGWSKDVFKDFRKNLVSLVATVHSVGDLDFRILYKFMNRIYLPGANPLKNSLVNKRLIAKLNVGQAIIEGSQFGIFKFKPIQSPPFQIKVEIIPKVKIERKDNTELIKNTILEVAKENGGYVRISWVKEKLKEKFSKEGFWKAVGILENEGILQKVRKDVWKWVGPSFAHA